MLKIIVTAAASTALAAMPALAAPLAGVGGGHVNLGANVNVNAGAGAGPAGAALDARLNSRAGVNASPVGIGHASPNSVLRTNQATTVSAGGRVNGKGALNASPTAIARASANSVLKNNVVVSGPLTGLTVGMHVVDSNGVMVGTVSKILTASGGRVVNVLVKPHSGSRTIPMSPTRLSLSGGVVTTTQVRGRI